MIRWGNVFLAPKKIIMSDMTCPFQSILWGWTWCWPVLGLVVWFCPAAVTYLHRPSTSAQHPVLIWRSGVQADCGWSPCLGSPKANIKVSAGLCSHLELAVVFQLIQVVGRIQDGLFTCWLAVGISLSSWKSFSNSHLQPLHLQGHQENCPPWQSLLHFASLTSRPIFTRLIWLGQANP